MDVMQILWPTTIIIQVRDGSNCSLAHGGGEGESLYRKLIWQNVEVGKAEVIGHSDAPSGAIRFFLMQGRKVKLGLPNSVLLAMFWKQCFSATLGWTLVFSLAKSNIRPYHS